MKISIPQPCHENWQNMTSVEKGRFCGACQKKVHDFTTLSDKAILNAFSQGDDLCGRFLPSQLERELAEKTGTGKTWMAAAAGVLILSSVTANEAYSQTTTATEQHTGNKPVVMGKMLAPEMILVTGTVVDEFGQPLPGCSISAIQNANTASSDIDGHFSIIAKKGTHLQFSYVDYEIRDMVVTDDKPLHVNMAVNGRTETVHHTTMGFGIIIGKNILAKKRTFFGRIFHSIGSLFR